MKNFYGQLPVWPLLKQIVIVSFICILLFFVGYYYIVNHFRADIILMQSSSDQLLKNLIHSKYTYRQLCKRYQRYFYLKQPDQLLLPTLAILANRHRLTLLGVSHASHSIELAMVGRYFDYFYFLMDLNHQHSLFSLKKISISKVSEVGRNLNLDLLIYTYSLKAADLC